MTVSLKRSQPGQIGLLVLLMMIVIMTLGISVATRSSGELAQSRSEEESSRAFDAAESGVEKAVAEIVADPDIGASSGTVSVGGFETEYTIDPGTELVDELQPGEVAEVKMGLDTNSNFAISWSSDNCGCGGTPPAAVITFYKDDGAGNYSVERYAYDQCNSRSNSFDVPYCNNGRANPHASGSSPQLSRNWTSQTKLARIKILYGAARVRVAGDLPVQNYTVTSQARATSGETREITLERDVGAAPSLFDYVLFAGGSIQNN